MAKPLLLLLSITLPLFATPASGAAKGSEPEQIEESEEPLFHFGLIADIQHADKDAKGKRRYRESLDAFRRCVDGWREHPLSFTLQLGDLVDGRATLGQTRKDLDAVLGVYASLPDVPHRHVIGNHCLTVPRPELERRLGLIRSWYAFERAGWRFIALDSLDLSTFGRREGSPIHAHAQAMLADLKESGAKNAHSWNGGVSDEQLQWLDDQLADADQNGQRAVVLSHLPVLGAASSEAHLIWNHGAVRKILNAHPSTHAFLAGHDHAGGYATEGTVHHLTVPGMVEAPIDGNAYATVQAFPNRLVIDGVGTIADRVLEDLTQN